VTAQGLLAAEEQRPLPGDESTPPRGTADIVAAVVRPRKQRVDGT
jgi:hypothetical protein